MFNSTFFKFLITFAVIIGASFLVMGVAGFFDSKESIENNNQTTLL